MKRSADVAFTISAVEHGGFLYSTLDHIDPDSMDFKDQGQFKSLPRGWELVPDDQDIVDNVVKKFTWGTGALVLANGHTYTTEYGQHVSSDRLLQRDNRYKPKTNADHFMRVLIRCPSKANPPQSAVQLGTRLWKSRRFTDCTLRCEGEDFHCHCAVLCDASNVFERMFTSNFQEATSRIVEIVDAKPPVVEALLSFIYNGTLKENFTDLVELAVLADRYSVEAVLVACAKPLCSNLSPSTAPRVVRALKIFKDRPEPFGSIWKELQQKVAADPAICGAVMAEV